MSLYSETRAADLHACFRSILDQELPPDELVCVFDGPVNEDCKTEVSNTSDEIPITIVDLPQNVGLGRALAEGIERCRYHVVARMDSDDVCLPDRFGLQVQYLAAHPDVSVVGGVLRENYFRRGSAYSVMRTVPPDHDGIVSTARMRNPVNHPTVMFKKNDVISSGNYQHMPLLEDYYLWVRMLQDGFIFANLPDVLVEAGTDQGFFERRGGGDYFASERRLAREFRRIGFHSRWDSMIFLLSRIVFRFLPVRIRSHYYPQILRSAATE